MTGGILRYQSSARIKPDPAVAGRRISRAASAAARHGAGRPQGAADALTMEALSHEKSAGAPEWCADQADFTRRSFTCRSCALAANVIRAEGGPPTAEVFPALRGGSCAPAANYPPLPGLGTLGARGAEGARGAWLAPPRAGWFSEVRCRCTVMGALRCISAPLASTTTAAIS